MIAYVYTKLFKWLMCECMCLFRLGMSTFCSSNRIKINSVNTTASVSSTALMTQCASSSPRHWLIEPPQASTNDSMCLLKPPHRLNVPPQASTNDSMCLLKPPQTQCPSSSLYQWLNVLSHASHWQSAFSSIPHWLNVPSQASHSHWFSASI